MTTLTETENGKAPPDVSADRLAIQRLPLLRVHPNPWQTRAADDDPAHLADLAASIREQGLLQIPTARPHPKKAGHVELAFGHSRLAAFHHLAGQENAPGFEPAAYRDFPVIVRPLTDREMSDLAAAENARRKNLSAIETAQALARRIKDFKLTHAEAGQPFGLGESAVSNLLRLLKLPDAVQAQVAAGEVPERLARQLVNLSLSHPDAVEEAARVVAKADPADREHELREAFNDILFNEDLPNLNDMPWRAEWLAKPVPADETARAAGVDDLRACRGCPHRFRYEYAEFCTLKPCYDAKLRLHVRNLIDVAQARLKIPAAGEGEQVQLALQGTHWEDGARAKHLIAAGKKEPALGLRLMQAPEPRHAWRESTGDHWIALGTVNLRAVQAWLKANPIDALRDRTPDARKASAPDGQPLAEALESAETAAAAQREREEREQEKRRRERAAKQQALHDIAWLVRHATPLIARQLKLAEPGLGYVVRHIQHDGGSGETRFPGLPEWLRTLEKSARSAKGKEGEQALRELLVGLEIKNHAFPSYQVDVMIKQPGLWVKTCAQIKKRAELFGAKLPPGWDRPPIHRTAYNCWQCGAFTGAERVTKRDEAAGWLVAGKPEKPDGVWCSEAHRAEFVRASGKVAAPKATAKKGKRK